jgi:hypothetical protein
LKARSSYFFLVLVIIATAFVSACDRITNALGRATPTADLGLTTSDEPPTATITPDPYLGLPPAASFQIDAQTQVSGIGSYCWPGVAGQFSACADAIGIPTAQEPIRGETILTATLELPLEDPPTELQMRVEAVTEADEMEETARGLRWWPPKPVDPIQLPPETATAIPLSLEPGLYVISVFARWEGVGDVIYGFLVEVVPQEALILQFM